MAPDTASDGWTHSTVSGSRRNQRVGGDRDDVPANSESYGGDGGQEESFASGLEQAPNLSPPVYRSHNVERQGHDPAYTQASVRGTTAVRILSPENGFLAGTNHLLRRGQNPGSSYGRPLNVYGPQHPFFSYSQPDMSASPQSYPFQDMSRDTVQGKNRAHRSLKVKRRPVKKEKTSREAFLGDGDDEREDETEKLVPEEHIFSRKIMAGDSGPKPEVPIAKTIRQKSPSNPASPTSKLNAKLSLHSPDLAGPSRLWYNQTPLLSRQQAGYDQVPNSMPSSSQSGIVIGSSNQAAISGSCFEQPLAPKSSLSKALVPIPSQECEEHAPRPPVTPSPAQRNPSYLEGLRLDRSHQYSASLSVPQSQRWSVLSIPPQRYDSISTTAQRRESSSSPFVLPSMSTPEQGMLYSREQVASPEKGKERISRLGASPTTISVTTAPENSELSLSARKVLRRKFKEDLLQEALGYPYALKDTVKMKKYLCFDDDEDPNALKVPAANVITKEWMNYERHVWKGNSRETQPIRVYGTRELYELDRLKCWVNFNSHKDDSRKPWPPGYTPRWETDNMDNMSMTSVFSSDSTVRTSSVRSKLSSK